MTNQVSDSAFSEFFAECEEIIQRVNNYLSTIEQSGSAKSVIDSLYRDIHTIKGSAQLFGFTQIGQIAHAMEASLEPVRSKNLQVNSSFVDKLYKCLDLIEQIVKSKASSTDQSPVTNEKLSRTVSQLIEDVLILFGSNLATNNEAFPHFEEIQKILNLTKAQNQDIRPAKQSDQKPLSQVIQMPIKELREQDKADSNYIDKKTILKTEIQMSDSNTAKKIEIEQSENKIHHSNSANSPIIATNAAVNNQGQNQSSTAAAAAAESSTIRIPVTILDSLMNLVGELVLVRNQVIQYSQVNEEITLVNLSQKLDLVTSEIQEQVMKTRMQPIGSILNKFNRVVRDLARELGKQIEFSVEGAETELDKTLIEAIKDPLTHIIRNSCDHGIETIEDRKANGKNPTGHIHIKSQQESGQVVVAIRDDGKGLHTQRILDKALEKRLITPEKAAAMSPQEIFQIIFMPGFSTAAQVSAVSGRGVGMDVVRTNIESIGGTIELDSIQGKGTVIKLKIPLTLAIVPALIAKSNEQRYAIPQVKLVELVRVDHEDTENPIELLQGQPIFRLRGSLLPLVSLAHIFSSTEAQQFKLDKNADYNIAVLNSDFGNFGLIVDEIIDTADIVVKPLAQFFKKLHVYSGATVMGDGSVALILDVNGIAQKAHLISKNTADSQTEKSNSMQIKNSDTQELLAFHLNSDGIFTIPLCLVQRLEEFEVSQLEHTGKQRVVQHRSGILPILSLDEYFGHPAVAYKPNDIMNVIVIQKRNRTFGIEVKDIADIINVINEIEEPIKKLPGIMGSIILENEVGTVIDILNIIETLTGDKALDSKDTLTNPVMKKTKKKTQFKILLAEDTSFFARQIIKILSNAGHTVIHAPDGEKAFEVLSESEKNEYDLIISDIEMPKLNGFQFAEKVRQSESYQQIPMIAVTTRFRDVDREMGQKVGFNQYLEKLNGDKLIEAIQSLMEGA